EAVGGVEDLRLPAVPLLHDERITQVEQLAGVVGRLLVGGAEAEDLAGQPAQLGLELRRVEVVGVVQQALGRPAAPLGELAALDALAEDLDEVPGEVGGEGE